MWTRSVPVSDIMSESKQIKAPWPITHIVAGSLQDNVWAGLLTYRVRGKEGRGVLFASGGYVSMCMLKDCKKFSHCLDRKKDAFVHDF